MSSLFKFLIALSFFAFTSPSFAQATRTWVSGVGDDANPCSRTAPCKTFAGAISKTAANGEINCLDPGGFGAVTITKSITIDCTGTMGSILNSGTNGIVVNDSLGATPNMAEVIVRGLTIDGGGSTPGLNGIRFVSGRSLVLENLFIQNQNSGNGISIQPGGSMEFYAENVTVTDGGGGILLQPTGAGSLRAAFHNVRSQNNSGTGIRMDSSNSTSTFGTAVLIDGSNISGNADGILIVSTVAGRDCIAMITDTNISAQSGTGLSANGPSSQARVAGSTITRNSTGISTVNGGAIFSYGTNRVDANSIDGTFTGAIIPQK